jgi:flagellar basal-body rod modification protein FlgD
MINATTHAATGVGTGTNGTATNTGTTGTGGTTGSTGTTGTGTTGTGTSTAASGSSATSLGGADFLTLMLAQLKNQDPTSPVDSNTFLQQLAALSEVQGINGLNTSFASLSSSLTSNQTLQASSLLGHQALVASGTAAVTATSTVSGAVNVPQTTSQVVLNISDASGQLVRQINLGAQSTGLATFSWDGLSGAGTHVPAGNYTLSATYAGATTGSTAASTLVNGTVESVSLGAGSTGMTVNVAGVGSVPFSSVTQISN